MSETVYRGKIRTWGKTRKSLGVIHVPKTLAEDLMLWRQQCPDSSPEAFIFPNKQGGFLDTGNYRKRVLHKLAADLELPKLTFQVIRRTIATLAQKKGTVRTFRVCSGIHGRQRQQMSTCRRFLKVCGQRSMPSMQN